MAIDFKKAMQMEAEGKQSFGVRRILQERGNQIVNHGYDAKHDQKETTNSLLSAAYAYMFASMDGENNNAEAREHWPWDAECFHPKDKQRNLAKAGALIAATIDKLNEE